MPRYEVQVSRAGYHQIIMCRPHKKSIILLRSLDYCYPPLAVNEPLKTAFILHIRVLCHIIVLLIMSDSASDAPLSGKGVVSERQVYSIKLLANRQLPNPIPAPRTYPVPFARKVRRDKTMFVG